MEWFAGHVAELVAELGAAEWGSAEWGAVQLAAEWGAAEWVEPVAEQHLLLRLRPHHSHPRCLSDVTSAFCEGDLAFSSLFACCTNRSASVKYKVVCTHCGILSYDTTHSRTSVIWQSRAALPKHCSKSWLLPLQCEISSLYSSVLALSDSPGTISSSFCASKQMLSQLSNTSVEYSFCCQVCHLCRVVQTPGESCLKSSSSYKWARCPSGMTVGAMPDEQFALLSSFLARS